MARSEDGDREESTSEKNADIDGENNEIYQTSGDAHRAGRDLNINKNPEGQQADTGFDIAHNISRWIWSGLSQTIIGRIFEKLFRLLSLGALVFGVCLMSVVGYVLFNSSNKLEAIVDIGTKLSTHVISPLKGSATAHPELSLPILVVVLIAMWFGFTKVSSKCHKCGREFAIEQGTKEYPSRASFDNEGNQYVPSELEQWCVYCDGGREDENSRDGNSSLATDGGERHR